MRLELGDSVLNNGILPEGDNFSDEELSHFYTEESQDFWEAIARAFDSAASRWGAYPTSIRLGPESQQISAAQFYKSRAEEARTKNRRPESIVVTKAEYSMDVD